MRYIWQHPAWPGLNYDRAALQRVLADVSGTVGRLAGLRAGLSETERRATLVGELSEETVSSFAIEGEAVDPNAIRQSLIASLDHRDRARAAGGYRNLAAMMLDAREAAEPMTLARLNGWHRSMFEGTPLMNDIGRLRRDDMQIVTIRRGEVRDVHFEAPPPDRLAHEMDALIAWLARTGPGGADAARHATAARAALAHLHFETIHPFQDGNGRIGRALADFVMAQDPLFAAAPFSLSRVIQEEKDAYYDALQTAQAATGDTIDVTAFVRWFAEATLRAVERATAEVVHLQNRNAFFRSFGPLLNARQDKALRRLFDEGPERLAQGISRRPYQRITGAPSATASRDLADLAAKGVLLPSGKGGRSTSFLLNTRHAGAEAPAPSAIEAGPSGD
ncbi:hypothetical protein ATO13_21371 [Stappia sp. 22II-S9-Z10]|nr:hypothetical protein ATO13_21371 [Stappia sp. 22II-S9-Z10]